MLAAVLLHVIQSPHAINDACDSLVRIKRGCAFDYVVDSSSFIFEDIDDPCLAERSDIVGLAPSGRIKGSLVQHDTLTAFGRLCVYNYRGEFEQA